MPSTAISLAMSRGALTRSDPQFKRRLQLFMKTSGKGLSGTEIDEAIEWCEVYKANPFTKDIYFFVFDANDASKRRVVPVLAIQLYRKRADSTGCYRPDDRPARFTYDDSLRGPANPAGILSVEVSVYKYVQKEWHPVTIALKWSERAPIRSGGSEGEKWEEIPGKFHPEGKKDRANRDIGGKPVMRKVPVGEVVMTLDPGKPNWRDMPETMLEKCAEAACIRKAFPDQVEGTYSDGELDQAAMIELTATEILEAAEQDDRISRIGAERAIVMDWMDKKALDRVPVGQFFDRCEGWLRDHSVDEVTKWAERNKPGLQEFWAFEKDAALQLKGIIERKLKSPPAPGAQQDPPKEKPPASERPRG
jgi:phage recombination protein Bet